MHPDLHVIRDATRTRITVLAAAVALLASSLVAVVASPASAAVIYDHSITACQHTDMDGNVVTSIEVPADGVSYKWDYTGTPEDAVGEYTGRLWYWVRPTANGQAGVPYAASDDPTGTRYQPGVNTPGLEGFANGVFVLEFWAVSGIDPTDPISPDSNAELFGDENSPLCTLTVTFLPADDDDGDGGGIGDGDGDGDGGGIGDGDGDGDGGGIGDGDGDGDGGIGDGDGDGDADERGDSDENADSSGGTSGASVPKVTLSCAPLSAPVGATVTCVVTGGDPGISMLWRASYNPVFAAAGVTLGADGTGTFSFVVPAAASGQEVMVELVEWTAPVSIGVAGGGSLVPTSVPAGEGPDVPIVPLAVTVASALVAGMVVRRWAVELRG
jgi:hypothetical protein